MARDFNFYEWSFKRISIEIAHKLLSMLLNDAAASKGIIAGN